MMTFNMVVDVSHFLMIFMVGGEIHNFVMTFMVGWIISHYCDDLMSLSIANITLFPIL